MESFILEVAEAVADTYEVRFTDCKEKVAQAFPQLDLSNISTVQAAPEEEEKEGAVKKEATGTEESTADRLEAEVAATEGPEDPVTALKVQPQKFFFYFCNLSLLQDISIFCKDFC